MDKACEEFKAWGRCEPSNEYKAFIDKFAGSSPAAAQPAPAADPMGYEPGAKLPRCVTAENVRTLADEFRHILADMRRISGGGGHE